jgi:hypothetical protein
VTSPGGARRRDRRAKTTAPQNTPESHAEERPLIVRSSNSIPRWENEAQIHDSHALGYHKEAARLAKLSEDEDRAIQELAVEEQPLRANLQRCLDDKAQRQQNKANLDAGVEENAGMHRDHADQAADLRDYIQFLLAQGAPGHGAPGQSVETTREFPASSAGAV